MDISEKRKLRELRKAAGLTQTEAARLSGTPVGTWRNWESEGGNARRVPGIAVAWLELYVYNAVEE